MSYRNSISFIVLFFISIFSCKNNSQHQKDPKSQISIEYFHDAAYNGNFEKVREALEAGMPADIEDKNGQNALMLAAFNGHTEIIKILVEEGVPINNKDKTGRTALIYASTGPYYKTVQFLINNNAEVNIFDTEEHFTALMFAASEGQLEVVKILLASGADLFLEDIDGDNAETFARQNEHLSVAQYLSKYPTTSSR